MQQESTERFVTRDELAARLAELELRIEQRFAAFEQRLEDRFAAFEQRMNDHFRTQTRWIVGLYAAVAIAAIVFAVR
jgi:hypothetical protein